MLKGKIKKYDSGRGCGIIVDTDSGRKFTVYADDVTLKEGEALNPGIDVTYEIETKRHVNWAVNVQIL